MTSCRTYNSKLRTNVKKTAEIRGETNGNSNKKGKYAKSTLEPMKNEWNEWKIENAELNKLIKKIMREEKTMNTKEKGMKCLKNAQFSIRLHL